MSNIPNVSLVAFYGEKALQLVNLIIDLQEYLANLNLGAGKFIPYQLSQVHGTAIGCEGKSTLAGIVSQWWHIHYQQTKYINFEGLIDYLNSDSSLPLTIRLGGYRRDRDYNFLSRQQHPWLRSFQLQPGGTGVLIPVLIGWSFQDNYITQQIDRLRRDVQQFNLLHKYHYPTEAVDNDFYLRLGTITGEFTPEIIQAIADGIRKRLAQRTPVEITIDRHSLAFAQYQDLTLTPATTKIIPVTAATAASIRGLY